MIKFTIPWPPSVNSYWRHPSKGKLAGRHLISSEGRAYRTSVMAGCHRQKVFNLRLEGRLEISLSVVPPDKRRRDLDNLLKSALDSIVHAGVVLDDSQFDRIVIARISDEKKSTEQSGLVYVQITETTKELSDDLVFLRKQAD